MTLWFNSVWALLTAQPLLFAFITQGIFSTGDFLAGKYLRLAGFQPGVFTSWWFIAFVVTRLVATTFQLYIFSAMDLGKVAVLLGACSIILSNTFSLVLLSQEFSWRTGLGILMAIGSSLLITWK